MRLRFGPFEVDAEASTLTRDGAPVPTQPKVLDAIVLFAGQPQHLFDKAELLRRLWPGVRVTEDALHQLLRKLRRALDDDPDAPRWIEAVPRRGWRFIGERTVAAEVEGDLLGRAPLLALVSAALDAGARRLALIGPPGVGKSRVAARIAERRGALRVALDGVADAESFYRRLGRALGVALDRPEPAPRLVARALLARGAQLLILDEAEGAVGVVREALDRWLGEAPELTVLVASRVAPGAQQEQRVEVPTLPAAAARALFRRRGGLDEAVDVDAIVDSLDRLPLALELAAARLAILSVEELRGRVAASPLSVGSPTRPGLDRALEASWALLTPTDRAVLAGLSVIGGGFRAADAEAVLPDVPHVFDALHRLHGASLLVSEGGRLSLLAVVRAFAGAQLDASGGEAERRRAWHRHLHARAHALLPGFRRWDAAAIAALGELAEPLLDATAGEAPDMGLVHATAAALRYAGPWSTALARLEEAVGGTDGAVPGEVRVLLAEFRARLGDPKGAMEALDAVLADPAADHEVRAFALFLRARLSVALGDPPAGAEAAAESERLAERSGNPALAALALDAAAVAAQVMGDAEGTHHRFREALDRVRGPSSALPRAIVAGNYAACLGRLGRHAEAATWLAGALDALESLPFPQLRSTLEGNLGLALLRSGRLMDARTRLIAAADGSRRVGDTTFAAVFLADCGMTEILLGGDAAPALEEARRLADPPSPGVERRRALAAWAEGHLDVAEARLAVAATLGGPEDRAAAARIGVALARARGDAALTTARLAETASAAPAEDVEAMVVRHLEGAPPTPSPDRSGSATP